MVRLIPKDEKFQELFVEDARIVLEAARKLEEMIAVYDRLDERVSEIRALEHEGDEIDNEVEARLDRAFITPFDREDIHELVVAHRRRARRHPGGRRDLRHLRRQAAHRRRPAPGRDPRGAGRCSCSEAIGKLETLKGIEPHVRQIHELENEADGLSRAAVARLFRDGIEAIEVIKWRDVYTALENTIDAAEDAVEVIERIVAKRTPGLALAGERHPVGDREHHVVHARVVGDRLVHLAQDRRVSWSVDRRVGDVAAPQHVVQRDQPARPDELDAPLVVGGIGRLVGVDEREVERPGLALARAARRASPPPARSAGRPGPRPPPRPSSGGRPRCTPRRCRSTRSARRAASPAAPRATNSP